MPESHKIRVLIVDDIPETRENIRKLLQFENDVDVVGVSDSGRKGIEAVRELKPDVVLMDICLPELEGISTTEFIRHHYPAVQVIILSMQGDPKYMRRAMLAGARDFLPKPPAADELISAIRRAGKMSLDERAKNEFIPAGNHKGGTQASFSSTNLGKVIVVYSPKGGCGATTLAVNLGIALHSEETKVALVDGNLQFGDLAVFLNEQPRNSILDLAPRADELDPEIIEEVLVSHASTGLKVLAAPSRPEYAENVQAEQFVKVIKYLRRLFAYVIIDASSMLTDIVLGAMDTSSLVILITTQEIPSIKNARLFLDLAQVLKIQRQRILFVVNRFDKRIGILPEKISESFKHEVAAVVPFDDRVVVPSINRGVPFMVADRSRPISKSILGLKDAVRQRINELSVEADKESILFRR
ncbi:MAG TPA: response regulator [Anaerolineales bacterium]|nr:response regulator [Anaerolineales bacterium]